MIYSAVEINKGQQSTKTEAATDSFLLLMQLDISQGHCLQLIERDHL